AFRRRLQRARVAHRPCHERNDDDYRRDGNDNRAFGSRNPRELPRSSGPLDQVAIELQREFHASAKAAFGTLLNCAVDDSRKLGMDVRVTWMQRLNAGSKPPELRRRMPRDLLLNGKRRRSLERHGPAE